MLQLFTATTNITVCHCYLSLDMILLTTYFLRIQEDLNAHNPSYQIIYNCTKCLPGRSVCILEGKAGQIPRHFTPSLKREGKRDRKVIRCQTHTCPRDIKYSKIRKRSNNHYSKLLWIHLKASWPNSFINFVCEEYSQFMLSAGVRFQKTSAATQSANNDSRILRILGVRGRDSWPGQECQKWSASEWCWCLKMAINCFKMANFRVALENLKMASLHAENSSKMATDSLRMTEDGWEWPWINNSVDGKG